LPYTISSLIGNTADHAPQARALLGLTGEPLDYRTLVQVINQNELALRERGILRSDRVAVVLPNGPRMATCFLSTASAAVCAPLNPAYSASEFAFFLEDLNPAAMIVEAESDSPAISVANRLGIPVLQMISDQSQPAGWFQLHGNRNREPIGPAGVAQFDSAQPGDIAMVLHTSGSTARPKQVPLTHQNLCESANNIRASLALSPSDRSLNIMPLFHVHGLVGALLGSLAAGGSVVCTPGFDATSVLDWLKQFSPTWYTAVPTMHQAIVARCASNRDSVHGSSLRFIRSCSSALPPKLMADLEAAFQIPVIEAYGMTEASHQMSINPLPPGERKPGSVGKAAGCEIAIRGEAGSMLPRGSVGDVVIRGINVTGGYVNNPEANASSFSDGWFSTGDRGWMDEDGYLFLSGRTKEIINRGGEKISPREIDEILIDHLLVAQAMAFAVPDERLGEDVAALVVLREPAGGLLQGDLLQLEATLREFAGRRLADFKVPRRILFVDEIPKGPTGKPQRIGLAQRLGITEGSLKNAASGAVAYTPPGTALERRVTAIWEEILKLDRISIHDEFLEVGGDSILAARIIARIRAEFGVELPIYGFFDRPTISTISQLIERLPAPDQADVAPIEPIPRDRPLALSFTQQRMWFLSQFEEEGAAYVIPVAYRLKGPLRVDVLQASLDAVVERHEILRTTYLSVEGVPVQAIGSPEPIPLAVVELEQFDSAEREIKIQELVREQVRQPFDLSRDRPLRVALMKCEPDEHVLLVMFHHIASDGWSKSIFFRALTSAYEAIAKGEPPVFPASGIQFADYAAWQSRLLDGKRMEGLVEYWKRQLADAPPLLGLPTDRPRPGRQTYQGSIERSALPKDLSEKLRELAKQENASLFMLLLAAFQALLHRYSGQTDICVGSPIAHRTSEQTEGLIGFFVNVLVLRTDVSGSPTFRELLGRVRSTALGAYEHQDLPFERLIDVVSAKRSMSYSPLFQVMFQLRNFPEIVTTIRGLQISALDLDPGTAQFDLSLDVTETDQGFDCALNFNTDLFDASTARRMLGHYRTLLEAAAQDPGIEVAKLPILTDPERRQLLLDWNNTARDYPQVCAHQWFEEQARRTPNAVAAVFEKHSWTYADLNRHADGIALCLRGLGASPGATVAICVGRSLEMLASLLGIWKSGAAYVPLDPNFPKERLQFILDDSGAVALITEKKLQGTLKSQVPVLLVDDLHRRADNGPAVVQAAVHIDNLAYLLYTSGSTGKPKGVAIRHRSLSNLLESMRREIEPAPGDVLLALTTISFDISILELFLPLVTGGCVHIAHRETAADGRELGKAISKSRASIVQATPATWLLLTESGWTTNANLKLICGGEAFPARLTRPLSRFGTVWNGYGPTETTIYSTIARLDSSQSTTPIGKPIGNTRVYVLDGAQQPVPIGVPGELYIGGDGVASGYWRQSELTSAKFIRDPFSKNPDAILYRTGDLVRYLEDGNLEFLQRVDNQVKVRGFRIELGEIESILCGHPGIRTAAVVVVGEELDDKRLVAFVVGPDQRRVSEQRLRVFLQNKLPEYMVPSAIVALDELPLTPNGKVDRKALVQSAPIAKTVPALPSVDIIDTTLAQIWEDVLKRRPIGPHDDFFEMGGHSLLSARLIARVEKAFGEKLGLVDFLGAPTIAQMAGLLRGRRARFAPAQVVPIRSSGSRPPLLFLGLYPLLRPLILRMSDDQPIYGILAADPSMMTMPFRLQDIAESQIKILRDLAPSGPYLLAGWCNDGVLALEIARQLSAQGESVPFVVLFDSFNPVWRKHRNALARRMDRMHFHFVNLARMGVREWPVYCRVRMQTLAVAVRRLAWRAAYKLRLRTERRRNHHLRDAGEILNVAVSEYEPQPYAGPVALIRPKLRPAGKRSDSAYSWTGLIPHLQIIDVPGDHVDMFQEPNVEHMASSLNAALSALNPSSSGKESGDDGPWWSSLGEMTKSEGAANDAPLPAGTFSSRRNVLRFEQGDPQ
jgi:amino acid adenylation domain-containing protein